MYIYMHSWFTGLSYICSRSVINSTLPHCLPPNQPRLSHTSPPHSSPWHIQFLVCLCGWHLSLLGLLPVLPPTAPDHSSSVHATHSPSPILSISRDAAETAAGWGRVVWPWEREEPHQFVAHYSWVSVALLWSTPQPQRQTTCGMVQGKTRQCKSELAVHSVAGCHDNMYILVYNTFSGLRQIDLWPFDLAIISALM